MKEAGSTGIRGQEVLRALREKGALFLILGGLCLIAAGAWYAVGKRFDAWVQWLLVGGLIAVGLYLLLRPQDLRAALSGRAVRYGSNALVLSVAVIGIVVLLNYLSSRYYKRFDVTEIKQHSLSEQSIQIVKGLKDEIEVIGFYPNGRDREAFEKWLDEYNAHTDRLRYQTVDPILEPGKAEQYVWSGYSGGLIVQRGSRRQQVYTADEQDITSALLRVSRDAPKSVYFLTGHKERSPTDYEQTGYGQIGRLLQDNNYQVETLNLAITDTVPLGAALIVIAGPQTPFLEGETGKLIAYLQNGGKALVMVDPGSETNINDILAPWNVRMERSLVIDARNALGGDPTTPVIDRYLFSQITKDLPMVALPYARPIVQTEPVGEVTFTPLAESSAQSWAKTDLENLQEMNYQEGQDVPGPLTLVATVESAQAAGSDQQNPSPQTRLVLIGDTDLGSNGVLQQIPNGQFLLLNAVNWLTEEEALIAIGPKSNVPRSIYLSTVQQGAVCLGTLIFVPAAILIAGLAVWLKRR